MTGMGPKFYLSAFLIAGAKHTSDTTDSGIAFMKWKAYPVGMYQIQTDPDR